MIDAMSATMNKMGSYMVMAFFCALFIKAFGDSNLGNPAGPSPGASAARPGTARRGDHSRHDTAHRHRQSGGGLGLRQVGTHQPHSGAHADGGGDLAGADPGRVSGGDSASNIITLLMVFFLVVVCCQQYVKSTGMVPWFP